jgi:beta-phosphoglucomutase-like phosphatase (HAD superfamily)
VRDLVVFFHIGVHPLTIISVRHEGIFQFIETIVTGDDPVVKNGKPAPDIYLEAARRLSIDPKDCLVFEDALSGVRCVRSSRVSYLWHVQCIALTQTCLDAYV